MAKGFESKNIALLIIALVLSLGAGSTVFGAGSDESELVVVSIDGIDPTAEYIADGSYALQRDLILVTKDEPKGLTLDFINWILSAEGQAIVEESGFASLPGAEEYVASSKSPSGTLTVSGSSTVQPLMTEFVKAYQNTYDVKINIVGGGSGKGINDVMNDIADIGMISRDLKGNEMDLKATTIAKDGVVIVVDKAAGITNLKMEEVAGIYSGKYTNWSEVGGNDVRIVQVVREAASGTRSTLDNAVSEILDISALNLGAKHMISYSLSNSTGAMLSNLKSNNGAIGYVNMNGLSSL